MNMVRSKVIRWLNNTRYLQGRQRVRLRVADEAVADGGLRRGRRGHARRGRDGRRGAAAVREADLRALPVQVHHRVHRTTGDLARDALRFSVQVEVECFVCVAHHT